MTSAGVCFDSLRTVLIHSPWRGDVFLAWNMHSKNGRQVGAGAYVAHLTLKATAGSKVVARSKENSVWGVRRTAR
jgi:hypothetical protein